MFYSRYRCLFFAASNRSQKPLAAWPRESMHCVIDAKPADTGMDVDVHSKPDENSTKVLDTTAAITDLDSNIEYSQTEATGGDVAQDTFVELAAEPPRTMRPTRAANDPREVKRREREAALKAQGVSIANSSSSQDTTEGSSSS